MENVNLVRCHVVRKAELIVSTVFPDGPHILPPSDTVGLQPEVTASELATSQDQPRAWWRSNEARTVYSGWEESVASIKQLMTEGSFDVCVLVNEKE
jgi:hypothetical protein